MERRVGGEVRKSRSHETVDVFLRYEPGLGVSSKRERVWGGPAHLGALKAAEYHDGDLLREQVGCVGHSLVRQSDPLNVGKVASELRGPEFESDANDARDGQEDARLGE